MDEYCGIRQPWAMLVRYRNIILTIFQYNVLTLPELVSTFEVIIYNVDKHIHLKPSVTSKSIVERNVMQSIYHKMKLKFTRIHWLVNAGHGFIVYFMKIKHSNTTAHIVFHDGPKTYHVLEDVLLSHTERSTVVNLDIKTVYFSSLVVFEFLDSVLRDNHESFFRMDYEKIHPNVDLFVHSTLSVNNIPVRSSSNYPMQKMIAIVPQNGTFISMSFTIHKFSGWTLGSCYYGGYLLFEGTSSTLENNTSTFIHGPYCNVTISNYPLLSSHGLQRLVLGSKPTVLVFYAYSPLYSIDLDIHVHQSVCEGILNPIKFCSNYHHLQYGRQFIQSFVREENYELYCSNTTKAADLRIVFRRVCIVVQVTHVLKLMSYVLEVIGTANVQLQYSFPFTYDTSCPSNKRGGLRVVFTFPNSTHSNHLLQHRNLTVLSYNDIFSTLINYVEYEYSYHQPSYSISLTDTEFQDNMCAAFNSSSHVPSYEFNYNKTYMLLQLKTMCGSGVYRQVQNYLFTLRPYTLMAVDQWVKYKYYFSFYYINECTSSNNTADQLSLCLSSYAAQSMVFNRSEMHVVSHDTSVSIIYYKYSTCSTLKMVFHGQLHQLLSTIILGRHWSAIKVTILE